MNPARVAWCMALFAVVTINFSGCAVLYHVEVSDIDNTQPDKLKPFTILASETGINTREVAGLASVIAKNSQTSEHMRDLAAIIELFQMGPLTGNRVFDDTYAQNMYEIMYEKCPSGKVTGLTTVREMRKYPVVSGEIVKITGFCIANH